MGIMMGPNGHALPIATGAALEAGSGSGRSESITTDPGMPARAAVTKPEPKTPDEFDVAVPEQKPAPAVAPSDIAPPSAAQYQGMEDIDALHARFDNMETYLKRSLAVMTLHARFDNLEAWLKTRFGE